MEESVVGVFFWAPRLRSCAPSVHALKSSALSIGGQRCSKAAKALEAAANCQRAGDDSIFRKYYFYLL